MGEWNDCEWKFLRHRHCTYLPSVLKLSLLRYDENGQLDQSSIIPIIDGGTEGSPDLYSDMHLTCITTGFKGNARVILPGLTACMDCTLDLYPPQVRELEQYPVCSTHYNPKIFPSGHISTVYNSFQTSPSSTLY